ncbi:CKLF-like MARVEL transmembrane domain-containing protein 3 isoform X2 [Strigops habroptila]|nr:CKLF-like MARVEL transmembrane domain-containing protein 3 isoform X2 [Strigops habroptila]
MTAPLLEFLLALFLFFAYASKLNEKFKGLYWPLMDFLRCVTAAIIYFAISIAAVSKYNDGASKAAGVFGFIATIVYAIDFYITFNDLVTFLKQGSSDSPEGHKSEGMEREQERTHQGSRKKIRLSCYKCLRHLLVGSIGLKNRMETPSISFYF